MFQLKDCSKKIYYEPYPIGQFKDMIDSEIYSELVEKFPDVKKFEFKKDLGKKYSLSEKNNSKEYYNYIKKFSIWNKFYKYIKSDQFKFGIMDELKRNNIDLGIQSPNEIIEEKNLIKKYKKLFKIKRKKLYSRFEFSIMDAAGGHILPHTDLPSKIITIVIPILKESEWNPDWGGNTYVLKPLDITNNYNFKNKYLKFNEVEKVRALPFKKNSSTIFIKTFNSLHCVYPLTGPKNVYRKSLTINIELKN